MSATSPSSGPQPQPAPIRAVGRVLAVLVGVLLLLLLSPSGALACSVSYEGGDPNTGCSGAVPVVGALVVGATAASAAIVLALVSFVRGAMSQADLGSVLAAVAGTANPAVGSGIGARPQPPATTPAGANPYRPEIADQVPAYGQKGNKTTGVLDLGAGRVLPPQDSGYDGPALRLPKPRRGMDRALMAHVEAHAVAAMRFNGLTNATLYLNRLPCQFPHPLSGNPWGCENALERMLQPNETLTVYGPDGYARVFTGQP